MSQVIKIHISWKKTYPILEKFLAATPKLLHGKQRQLQHIDPKQQQAARVVLTRHIF
jgi:hypothetical protein